MDFRKESRRDASVKGEKRGTPGRRRTVRQAGMGGEAGASGQGEGREAGDLWGSQGLCG